MGYIYKITNQVNGKCYIGKTERTVESRWSDHKKNAQSQNEKLTRLPLYRAMRKYGIQNFIVEEIEHCEDPCYLDEREIYWVDFYQTYRNGYNCTAGGEGGIKDYHEDIEEIIARYKNGERLDALCREFHHDYTSIRPTLEAHGVIIDSNAGPKKLSKRVAAINPETQEIVAVYESISAAARAICKPGNVARSIGNHISKNKDTDKICHGFIWKTQSTLPDISMKELTDET